MSALRAALGRAVPRPRRPVWLGTIRRTRPVSEWWGRDRGTPIDRYYIESFLEEHRGDVRGRVLELLDDGYTERFGSGVEASDVLDVDPANSLATVVGDLERPESLPEGSYDCVVLTQTLQFVFDLQAAIRSVHRLLAPGGVVLATVPAVSRMDRAAAETGEYWRLTVPACRRLFGESFAEVEARSYGNVLAGAGFLMGLAVEDLTTRELDEVDPDFPVLVAVRAVRA